MGRELGRRGRTTNGTEDLANDDSVSINRLLNRDWALKEIVPALSFSPADCQSCLKFHPWHREYFTKMQSTELEGSKGSSSLSNVPLTNVGTRVQRGDSDLP